MTLSDLLTLSTQLTRNLLAIAKLFVVWCSVFSNLVFAPYRIPWTASMLSGRGTRVMKVRDNVADRLHTHFYRATRMRSADGGLCRGKMSVRPSVCLSVRSSHADILSKRLNISSNFLHQKITRPLVFFPYPTRRQYSDGYPLTGASNARGVWKNQNFRPIPRFISEIMQDRAIVSMEGESETTPKLSNGTSLNDLEWPLTHISRSPSSNSTSNNSKTVHDRTIFTMADQ